MSSRIVAVSLSFALVACATGQGRKLQTREATLASDILAASAEASGVTAAVTALEQAICRGRATKRAICHFRRAERLGWMEREPSTAAQETFDATASLPEPTLERTEPSAPASPARPTAAARRAPAARPVPLRGVTFGFDSTRLESPAREALDDALALLGEDPSGRIRIEGHADSVGPDEYNRTLSKRRARTISFYLAAHGIPRSRLHPVGLGEAHPVADNNTARGRARNRRAELTILQ